MILLLLSDYIFRWKQEPFKLMFSPPPLPPSFAKDDCSTLEKYISMDFQKAAQMRKSILPNFLYIYKKEMEKGTQIDFWLLIRVLLPTLIL